MNDRRLGKLPTISQLMDMKPLKELSQRVSSSTVAAGIQAYLEPYRQQILAQAESLPTATLQTLAGDISQWILGTHGGVRTEVINATGQILGESYSACPISDEILKSLALQRSYQPVQQQQANRSDVLRRICRATGADQAIVLENRATAMEILAHQLQGQSAVIPRAMIAKTYEGFDVADFRSWASGNLQELGDSNQVRLDQLKLLSPEDAKTLVWFDRTCFQNIRSEEIPSSLAAIQHARESQKSIWVDLGVGGLKQDDLHQELALSSGAQAISAGAELVLLSGKALLGCSGGAILLAKSELAKVISQQRQAIIGAASDSTIAALDACLRIYESDDRLDDRLPAHSLLTTSVENLELRANRICEQLQVCSWLADVEAVASEPQVLPGGVRQPSWTVQLQAKAEHETEVVARLAIESGIDCQNKSGRFCLDLRSVLPWQDSSIVDQFMLSGCPVEG